MDSEVNPLKSDPELVTLLKKLDSVTKYKKFQGWKQRFLDRLESFLQQNGMTPAQKACNDFDAKLTKFVKRTEKVLDFIKAGQLSSEKKSVKASLALNEMCNDLTAITRAVPELIPGNRREEKDKGFTKFHLGAVLIRQGFHQYATMKVIETAVGEIGGTVGDVADRQQHELFADYNLRIARFCDVMADLGLYEVMLKCIQFANPPEEDESEGPETINITIKAPGGITMRVELDVSESIGNIKDAIAGGCKIPPEKQILSFDGAELDDNAKTLQDLGIQDGDTLEVAPQKMPIVVNTMDGKQIKVMVDPANDTIGQIKDKIKDEAGMEPDNQKLLMNGIELENDEMTPEFYGIRPNTELDLEPKTFQVNVQMPDGKRIPIEVKPPDTADAIKAKIEQETGMERPRQVLKAEGKELTRGRRIKDIPSIQPGSTIDVEIFKVPVTVNDKANDKEIQIMVEPTNTLAQIKELLKDESGLAPENQKLLLRGKELTKDKRTAEDYGIADYINPVGATLDLEPKAFDVSVDMPDGTTATISVQPTDTAAEIKEAIAQETGMAVPRQVVKYNGEELPTNGETAADLGLQEGSTLQVEVFKVPIKVTNAMDGNEIKVMVDPTDKLGDIKVQLEKDSGISPDNQKLFMDGKELDDDNRPAQDYGIKDGSELDLEPKKIKVSVEMPDGKKHDIEVTPNDTANDIKAKIEKESGMAAPRQVLKDEQGNELPDGNGETVKDMGLKDGSPIKVEVFKVPIKVRTMDGKEIEAMVDPTDKLGDIKAQLEEESGIPPDNQKLFMDGKELDDDDKAAQDYGIKDGSELDLEPKKIKVTVEMPDGAKHDVEVTPDDTSDDIKAKIEQQTGMAAPRQVLKDEGGNELPSNGETVKDMGLKDGSPIKVEVFKVPIKVKTMDGKEIQAMVDPTDKLGDIKAQLEEESGIPPDNQKLFMDGNELDDDDKAAQDYGIKDGSELDLEPKKIKVTVEMPDGKKHDVEVTPNDTSDDIKAKIEQETGMAAPRQVLKDEGGNELPSNGETVKDMGLRDGSPIKVEVFKVPVKVKTMDGKEINVMVDPTDKLGDIKAQLEDESGIPPDNQELFMDGNKLDDDNKTAADYGIKEGSELDLEPKKIKVSVEMPDGEKHDVEVTPSDTSDDIKAKIEGQTGMAAPRQVLKDEHGNELPSNGETVKDMGLKDGSPIKVEVFKVPIKVKTMDGKEIKVMVDPTDKLGDIKAQLEDESGIPPDNQELFLDGKKLDDDEKPIADYGVKEGSELDLEPKKIKVTVEMPDGEKHDVEVTPSDTSDDIKAKIEGKTGMAAPRQVLKDEGGNELPSNGETVKDMGLREGSPIKVEVFKVPVTVKTMDGKEIKVMVDPTDKLGDIKSQLEEESGLPPENQELFMDGNKLDDDNKTAADYGIKEGSELDLEPKQMNVTVEMPNGDKHSFEVTPKDTSDDIKAKIEKETGMAAPRQVLTHEGAELPSNGETVKDMGLQDGSPIKVEVFKVPVTVKTMDGKNIKAMVDPTDKLSDIKAQLEAESGIPQDNQKLCMDGNELDDDNKTAADYGIKGGSVLDLEPKKIVVSVEMPNGDKHDVEVSPKDTSDDIKAKIKEKTGMAPKRQVLKHDGVELPSNGETVRKMGLKDGSPIKVEVFKVPIVVKTMDGKRIRVMVDPTDKLGDIKAQLQDESGLPPDNQKIFMDGNELDDDNKAAEDHGIKKGSELYLEPKKIKVTVEMPDGKERSIEVAPKDTADDIKAKIEKETGMAAPRQVLKHDGKELPTGKTVKDMGIREGSPIKVEVFKVPIRVNTMDGKQIRAMVDPTEKLGSIKKQLEGEADLPASNQNLFMNDKLLADDNKPAKDYGIQRGSELDLEPKTINVKVEMPDGAEHTVGIKPSDTSDKIKAKIAEQTDMEPHRQVLKHKGQELPGGKNAKDMGIREGDAIKVEILKVPVTVETWKGDSFTLDVEPTNTITFIKKGIERETGLEPKKQNLKFGEVVLDIDRRSAKEYYIKAGSVLTLAPHLDPIIFIDCKCGTLFGMDRELVIEKNALTMLDGNKLDFVEATKDSAAKDKIKKAMLASPKLGIAPQVVVVGLEVEDYDLQEAEKVKNMWGVNLKKREKNKKGEEFVFVDPKSGSTGELSRKKYVDMKFITPVVEKGEETLEEREKETMVYDDYVVKVRNVFGIKSAN